MYEKAEAKLTAAKQAERERERAIAADKRVSETEQSCWYCFRSNPKFKKHLMVSLGQHSYLGLPMVSGCVICVCVWVVSAFLTPRSVCVFDVCLVIFFREDCLLCLGTV